MTGVLDGVSVLDLSWGISGPMAGMLLADHGATVTRIEPPSGDPFRQLSGYQVWQRGKRSARLDLSSAADHALFLGLVRRTDVVVESFSPGTTGSLGIDYERLRDQNSRLIYCSITGYGPSGSLADRPGYDALVAARTGHIWETRGLEGSTPYFLAGRPDPLRDVELPAEAAVGAARPGPLFPGVPWISLGAFYLAVLGISAALRAREVTGRGQWVQTSLLQGALATSVYSWQRAPDGGEPGFSTWVLDPRCPKANVRAADGRWMQQWGPLPSFFLESTHGDTLQRTADVQPWKHATDRTGIELEETIALAALQGPMMAAAARFHSAAWVEFAREVDVALQPVRSPEEALADPAFLADGCVVEVPDADAGLVRQVGEVYRLSACRSKISVGPPRPGQHDDEVRAEGAMPSTDPGPGIGGEVALQGPLAGVVVLEVGLVIAVPYGAQLLAELGATVIKINQSEDDHWMGTIWGTACNRGKRSLALDLRTSDGLDVFGDLVERADVVMTNMRYSALERLRIDYKSLEARQPRLVYCHTRGFERGERASQPGFDQTGAALAGTEWLDGAMDNGGRPVWSLTSLGDLGVGFLAAIAVVQALFHRDRTGVGQFVDSSIIYAHLLNTSMAWASADGTATGDRPRLDLDQTGWGPLYRLYQTRDEWLCVAAVTEAHWEGLCRAIGENNLARDARFADAAARKIHAGDLAAELAAVFATAPAKAWWEALDRQAVPCEIAVPGAVEALFDDPELWEKGWITRYHHGLRGVLDTAGHLIDFSDTPGIIQRPSPLAGEHSSEILEEMGYDEDHIARLHADGVIMDPSWVAS